MSYLPKPEGCKRLPNGAIGFVGAQLRGDVHDLIITAFRNSGITQKELAERLGKNAAQINRLIGGSGNWTIDTVAQLLYAINGNIVSVSEIDPDGGVKANQVEPPFMAYYSDLLRHAAGSRSASPTLKVKSLVRPASGVSSGGKSMRMEVIEE